MARVRTKKKSTRHHGKFEESKHVRKHGRFANKPGAGDDAPKKGRRRAAPGADAPHASPTGPGKTAGVKDDDVIILKVRSNPKRAGSASAADFAQYKNEMTVGQYIQAVGPKGRGHIAWDIKKGFISVHDPATIPPKKTRQTNDVYIAAGKTSGVQGTDKIRLLAPTNPKKSGSASAADFAKYRDDMTVDEFVAAVGDRQRALGHLAHDRKKGFISVHDPKALDALERGQVKPPVAPPAQPPKPTGETPEQLRTRHAIEAVQHDRRNPDHNLQGDKQLRKFMELQGKDTSDVLSKAEFDKVQGRVILRGVASKNFVPSQYDKSNFVGVGIYGNGQYYGGPGSHDVPFGYGAGGHVWVNKLKAEANVIDYNKLQNMYARDVGTFQRNSDESRFASDIGRYAALKGYDAIEVGSPDYLVILNKRMVVVSKESLPGDAYEQKAMALIAAAKGNSVNTQLAQLRTQKAGLVARLQAAAQARGGQMLPGSDPMVQQLAQVNAQMNSLNSQVSQLGLTMAGATARVYNDEYGTNIRGVR